MSDLIAQFGGFGYTLISFIIALSIIVAIHEYGHYIVGRWSGIHTEVFSLGFGPVLYSRFDKRGTKWQIAAIPFGGYCKFLGDANAASVGSSGEISEADKRRTMLGAPIWARAITVLAGPVFNFIMSIVIFAVLFMYEGKVEDPVRYASAPDLPATYQNELQPGDQLLGVAGIAVPGIEGLGQMLDQVPVQQVVEYSVLRDGREITVNGPFPRPSLAANVSPNSAAYDAGIQTGDVLTEINGSPIFDFDQIIEQVNAAQGNSLSIKVWREGEELQFELSPREKDLPTDDGGFEQRWLIGIGGGLFFDLETGPIGLGESIKRGGAQVVDIMSTSLSGLYHMLAGSISSCNLSGPVGIAQASGAMASQGLASFFWFIALLSTAVGLLNLFPIPVLDGGHLVFHAYEAVTGKPPSEKALNILMIAGLTLILSMTVLAIANDLFLCA